MTGEVTTGRQKALLTIVIESGALCTVRANVVDADAIPEACALPTADNMEIVPLLNGRLQINLMFYNTYWVKPQIKADVDRNGRITGLARKTLHSCKSKSPETIEIKGSFAASQGESINAFLNRADEEIIERGNQK